MHKTSQRLRARLIGGAAGAILLMAAGAAAAQDVATFNIAPQPLADALKEFGYQSGHGVLASPSLAQAKVTRGVTGEQDVELALNQLLDGSGLTWRRSGETFLIVDAAAPQFGSAAGDGADGTVDTLIVTAQKREENIQDVPIAISAFSQTALEEQKIEGGFDLLKAIPNVTFSKNNFTGYNFSIRGIGTKAISATTDPGVAVAFNYSGMIQNRLFEQEYFDVERVEVLRGPQGTLYGRNATGGVINVISAKPQMSEFEGWVKGEVGNYDTKRLSAMVNVPLVGDKVAMRLAGALTSRQGYGYNEYLKTSIDGRDLWSARLSLAFEPTETLRADLIWERFEEDDDRARTSKQLCHRDAGPTSIGAGGVTSIFRQALFSTGCKAGSMYDPAAFGTPNGLALPYVYAVPWLGYHFYPIGFSSPSGGLESYVGAMEAKDPYGGMMQSRDLRTISSIRQPIYRARADVLQLNVGWDFSDTLSVYSQTMYNKDEVYSFQDYNRFNTVPVFTDTSSLYWGDQIGASPWANMMPGGIFCDPQIGCSNSLAVFDISQAESEQFSQELRLQSDFDGSVNFSAGFNYTDFELLADYYVMSNMLTLLSIMAPFNGQSDYTKCNVEGPLFDMEDPRQNPLYMCIYVDPNPVESINGEGHNYYRSKNPYELESYAAFGEVYREIGDQLKLTGGLRYTVDRKTFTPVPSQLLLGTHVFSGGYAFKGYPARPDINQEWKEVTGRLGFDWKPDLTFTDESMIYASYSRGYKGGGANPPGIGFMETIDDLIAAWGEDYVSLWDPDSGYLPPMLTVTAANYPDTFRPEFVDAFEVGAKNTLLGGALTLNMGAFYYDYTDYQVSKIVDRTAVNENFDAKVWGVEFETIFAPSPNLRVIANLGYLDTEIGEGARSIDIMNRTQGNPDWVVVKPWVQLPSNCVVPFRIAEWYALYTQDALPMVAPYYGGLCGGAKTNSPSNAVDPLTGEPWDPLDYPEINGGAGIYDELDGNELPNSPHWTINIGAQYGVDFLEGWRATIRGDAYWQSQSWARVYNSDPYDKLHGWYNVNLSLWLERDDGLKIELYAKNLLDKTPITDAFLNSDDTGLTTNVFVLDPRLIGLSIRKEF